MNTSIENARIALQKILVEWLQSCTRGGKISRNTIAIGIVVLHHLRQNCPVAKEDVVSQGGEIKNARSRLVSILATYGIPSGYLKEVTTRQGHQDGQRLFERLEWGNTFVALSSEERNQLLAEMITSLTIQANEWLNRQNLKLDLDRRESPTTWINLIVENAKDRSSGIVEQHLIGAKLVRRFPQMVITNHPAHAGDRQTARDGDFSVSKMVYHVTAMPSRNVIQKCAANSKVGLHAILLIPAAQEYKARALAQDEGIDKELTIFTIESFVALNIIELAMQENKDFFSILQEIVQIYNQRLVEVETDLSLQIEIH